MAVGGESSYAAVIFPDLETMAGRGFHNATELLHARSLIERCDAVHGRHPTLSRTPFKAYAPIQPLHARFLIESCVGTVHGVQPQPPDSSPPACTHTPPSTHDLWVIPGT